MDDLRIGADLVSLPVELAEGENIKIQFDKESGKVIFSAPNINKTNIKIGAFTISGGHIEIEAGPGIKISSVHPNKISIVADTAKEVARIMAIETRVSNLEKAIVGLAKK